MNFLNRNTVSLCAQNAGLLTALEAIEAEIKKKLLEKTWNVTKNILEIPWTEAPVNPGVITAALCAEGWAQPLVEYVISNPHVANTRSLRVVFWTLG